MSKECGNMDDFRYYAHKSRMSPYVTHGNEVVLWKVNRKLNFGVNQNAQDEPWLTAYIGLSGDLIDNVPVSDKDNQYWRISCDAFKESWNKNFDSLQKARLHGGEYFIERQRSGNCFTFHAFLRNPSRHYTIECSQEPEYAQIDITAESNIVRRRGIANHNPTLPESVFCQAFKLALEFFYDGSAMPTNQGKLWEVLDTLGGSSEPDEPTRINENYYYQRARELMLKRKEEIKLRLLELDDAPSRRRELRAEMKGIDYCVSVLDKNH